MHDPKDISKFNKVLASMSTTYTMAMNLPVQMVLNEPTETIVVSLDGKEVVRQSIACDSYNAAVVDACKCIQPLASAFRDTYL